MSCAKKTCSSDQFKCYSGQCILMKWKCDGQRDCNDGTDESDCNASTCNAEQFNCTNGKCIDIDWRCDGDYDCSDYSDEERCEPVPAKSTVRRQNGKAKTCSSDQFKCDSGQCIITKWKCDGQKDCYDGTDELECNETLCRQDEFRCNNGICITKGWRCDGTKDCMEGEDEICASTCNAEQFNCTNGKCIDIDWRCDGDFDCSDYSDEENCEPVPAKSTVRRQNGKGLLKSSALVPN
ncbi:very low-density lipoprotein receptor-like [Mytilus trossulus]|uniref:very low-density lipoprotein receptor-like n=1 Tax=Mytilus trossulus TaxID=6551 RepID=UPI003005FD66